MAKPIEGEPRYPYSHPETVARICLFYEYFVSTIYNTVISLLSNPPLPRFNSIATTYMWRALSTLMDKLSKNPEVSSDLPKDLVEKVIQVSNGDIRSAIMSLQFSSLLHPASREGARKKAERVRHGREVTSL